jgi:DNA helicase HerA-like ATPase
LQIFHVTLIQQIRLGRRTDTSGDSSTYRLTRDRAPDERLITIPVASLTRHMCILGRTGGGKSFTAMVIARELAVLGGVSILILDRTGEFAHSPLASLPGATVYIPGLNLTLSPFGRRSDNSEEDIERAISLMHYFIGSSFKNTVFSPYQERALRDALKACYEYNSFSLSDVLSQLRAQGEVSRNKVKGWLEGNEAVISKLTPLVSGSLSRVFDADSPGLSESELFEPGLRIVDLGALGTKEARDMLSQILCKLLIAHGKKLGHTKDLRFVLIVDEAQHIAPNKRDYDGILEEYATELRKYGMGLIVIATRPTEVSENIIANSNTIISHSMTSGKDIHLALNYMVNSLEAEKFEADLRTLDVGECLVQLNDSSTVIPAGCRVGLPEHGFLLLPPPPQIPVRQETNMPKTSPLVSSEEVPAEDSARVICEKLPTWARRAAKLTADSGGSISRRSFIYKGHSLKQVKQMVHGQYPLLEESGSALQLTRLGRKIAAIEGSAV